MEPLVESADGAPSGSRQCSNCGLESADDGAVYCMGCGHGLGSVDASAMRAGAMLGSYRVLDLLGEGGMGRVYLAEHVKLGRHVAIKMLRTKYTRDPIAIARFFAEARAVNRISHENIVEITDFFENADGHNYYIMEMLKGEDVASVLLSVGVVPLLRAIDIAMQVASVLGAVHAAHIVHRDLKPENIFLVDRSNRPDFVKLLDFGVAKLTDPHDVGIQLGTTAAGTIIGTPEYMSPEQASGEPVDHRTDVYALGIILYEMVTGTVPFRARSFGEMLVKHLTVEPRRPNAHTNLPHVIPPALEDLILQLLRKTADERPQSMAEVEQRLRTIHDELLAELDEVTGGDRPSHPMRRASTDRPIRAGTEPVVVHAEVTGHDATMPGTPSSELRESSLAVVVPRRSRAWLMSAGLAVAVAGAVAIWFVIDRRAEPTTTLAPPAAPIAVAALPTQPSEIEIRFASTPAGATVHAAGSTELLGTTPFSRRFARDDKTIVFEVELAGYLKGTQEIRLANDATVAVALAPQPPPPQITPAIAPRPRATRIQPKPHNARPSKVDRGGTMGVFDD